METLSALAVVLIIGITAQWLAWRFRMPLILLLLIGGICVGPVFGLVKAHKLPPEFFFPLVSLSVAYILFEGSLRLKNKEIWSEATIVWRLTFWGVLISWALLATAAFFVLKQDLRISLLLGAILVVTGPTVILPLLRHINLKGRVASVLKWEGIIIDPAGALLALLVFEGLLVGSANKAFLLVIVGFLKYLFIGVVLGGSGAALITMLLRRHAIPEYLDNPLVFSAVGFIFIAGRHLQNEASGFLAVIVMGIVLANQRFVSVRHIFRFKEELGSIILPSLFILLASAVRLEDLSFFNLRNTLFLIIAVFVVRPATVYIATARSGLSAAEKLFLSFMAPRGIVAAAVASIFAQELALRGYPASRVLVSLTFFMILGTVLFYSLFSAPLARWLKLSDANPQGVLFLGAHQLVRSIAKELSVKGIRVLLIDSNGANIRYSHRQALYAYQSNILSRDILDSIDFEGIGYCLAMTSNDEANALGLLHFRELFPKTHLFQLPLKSKEEDQQFAQHLVGRFLFADYANFDYLGDAVKSGATVKSITLEEDMGQAGLEEKLGKRLLPLFTVSPERRLAIFSSEGCPQMHKYDQLIFLCPVPEASEAATQPSGSK